MVLRKLVPADLDLEFPGGWYEPGKIKLVIMGRSFFSIEHLDKSLPVSFIVHGDAGDKGKGPGFIIVHHFKIPALEITSLFPPAPELFGVEKSVHFVYDPYGGVQVLQITELPLENVEMWKCENVKMRVRLLTDSLTIFLLQRLHICSDGKSAGEFFLCSGFLGDCTQSA